MAGIGDVLAKTAGKGAGVSTVSSYCDCFILRMLHSFNWVSFSALHI